MQTTRRTHLKLIFRNLQLGVSISRVSHSSLSMYIGFEMLIGKAATGLRVVRGRFGKVVRIRNQFGGFLLVR